MLNYDTLSPELSERISRDRKNGNLPCFSRSEENVLRRNPERDTPTILRTPFLRDIDKIMHCPFYNRYADKTQVFSFYKNDDITRRALHVQLVSRIARSIGRALNLNLDLIEAIALGHDIGHTPLGHAGERYLDELYFAATGRHFAHNLHSMRVLDGLLPLNVSLDTLSGIISHNGELELSEYRPRPIESFAELDRQLEECILDLGAVSRLIPSTLEGCVVRISDIIAYLGKDRQDAERAGIIGSSEFEGGAIGTHNAEIINNLIVNIVENSYGKPYIKLDSEHFEALAKAKRDNYRLIYKDERVNGILEREVKPMMVEMYHRLLSDLVEKRLDSPIFRHHIDFINASHYKRSLPYGDTEPNLIVVDYIASMTDDYFVDLYRYLFPESNREIPYKGYFEENS